jgi:hypothetical protein
LPIGSRGQCDGRNSRGVFEHEGGSGGERGRREIEGEGRREATHAGNGGRLGAGHADGAAERVSTKGTLEVGTGGGSILMGSEDVFGEIRDAGEARRSESKSTVLALGLAETVATKLAFIARAGDEGRGRV